MSSWNLTEWMKRGLIWSESRAGRICGLTCLALAIGSCWWSSTRIGAGTDIFPLHFIGLGVLNGIHIYDHAVQSEQFASRYAVGLPEVVYPPSTGFAMAPFSLLPASLVPGVWLFAMIIVAVLGLRSLAQFLRPKANWALWAAVVLLSSCIRWGVTPLQGAPLMMGLLALFYPAVIREKYGRAGVIAAYAVAFKFTMALPFVGLLAIRRKWGIVLFLACSWAALNVLGFARVGGLTAFADYRHSVAGFESMAYINTPDPWASFSVPRVDLVYLLYGITRNVPLSHFLTLAACGLTLGYLTLRAWQFGSGAVRSHLPAFIMPLVCVSMLSVYHHHYDLALAAVPLMLAWLPPSSLPSAPHAILGPLTWPLAAVMAFVPVGTVQSALNLFSPVAVGIFHMAFPIATCLALFDSLRVLKGLRITG